MKPSEITTILKGAGAHVCSDDFDIDQLLTDSRRSGDPARCLFFAIPTKRNTGSRYVYDLYLRGVRNFVVPNDATEEHLQQFSLCTGANFWFVKDVVVALQQIVAARRARFSIPVVGITGSNGKTIVKDWIVQMVSDDCKTVSSPRSYIAQIGVPLAGWQMDDTDELAVFEAGISEPGEMDRLRQVINPTIGIFTNIGQAHDENFLTRTQSNAENLHTLTLDQTLV